MGVCTNDKIWWKDRHTLATLFLCVPLFFLLIPMGYRSALVERNSVFTEEIEALRVNDEALTTRSLLIRILLQGDETCSISRESENNLRDRIERGVSKSDVGDVRFRFEYLKREKNDGEGVKSVIARVLDNKIESLYDIDDTLQTVYDNYTADSSTYVFIAVASASFERTRFVMGRYRCGWIRISCKDSTTANNFRTTAGLMVETLSLLAGRSLKAPLGASAASPVALDHQLTFTFAIEEPLTSKSQQIHWDFAEVHRRFLWPFLHKIRRVSRFDVQSQYLRHIFLGKPMDKKIVKSDVLAFTRGRSLNFGLDVADRYPRARHLHFVLYLPSHARQPLSIFRDRHHRRNSQNEGADALVVTNWGGLSILNYVGHYNVSAASNGPHMLPTNTTLKRHMGVFVSQLRRHLGLRGTNEYSRDASEATKDMITFLAAREDGICQWELDALHWRQIGALRRRTVETLQSLSRTIVSSTDMVVKPHMTSLVRTSLDLLQHGDDLLSSSQDRVEAVDALRGALELAEGAAYDPTTIRAEHFDPEYFLCIFLPLLAPSALPVLAAVARELKKMRGRVFRSVFSSAGARKTKTT